MSLLALLINAPAFACPTIATGTPSELSFDVAQVAIVRQDNRTTFSVSVNPAGEAQDFALVLPVPVVLAEDEIKTLDPEVFARLDGYTAPRHVSDAGCPSDTVASSDSAGSAGGGAGSDGGVDVEAEYLIGEYEIVILSAEESGSLYTWLDSNGYHLAEGAEPRLQEYIDAGSYFMAARVSGEAAVATGEALSPLQVSYDSEIFSIPIRLAAVNSPGEQDMIIYAFTEMEGTKEVGRVGISNYAEFEVPDKCVWGDPGSDDFNEFYEDLFTDSWATMNDAAWTIEYAGTWNDCSPCSGTTITEHDVFELGFDKSVNGADHHLTRIRMRYTPEQAVQDLVFYGSGLYQPEVTSFADDYSSNYSCIESFCDGTPTPGNEGGTDGGGADGGGGTDGGGADDGVEDPVDSDAPSADPEEDEGRGCSAVGTTGGGAVVLLLGLVGLASRRRDWLD